MEKRGGREQIGMEGKRREFRAERKKERINKKGKERMKGEKRKESLTVTEGSKLGIKERLL